MKTHSLTLLSATLAAISLSAQPSVYPGGVVNAASYSKQGLPSSGIGQGSIFSVFGTAIGPSAGVHATSFPLLTSLGNTSVAVTVNGTTVDAIMLFAGAGQVNAIMPSNTPIGSGTLTVTYNSQTSASVPVQVVASSFGIFTVNSSGSGPGIFTNGQNRTNSFVLAANPGEILNIWGTGLGAISGSDTGVPPTGNITANSPTVYVGGVQVKPSYHGRSGCCAAVDQIQIKIPQNIYGCTVPVAVQIGDTVSNFVTISTTAAGATCSDALTGLSGSTFSQFFTKGSASLGFVDLSRDISTQTLPPPLGTGMPTTTTTDSGSAGFNKDTFTSSGISGLSFELSNFGACSVFGFSGQSATIPSSFTSTGLDAGADISVNGPNGIKQLTPLTGSTGSYFAQLGSSSAGGSPLYLSQGSYTVTGPGGKDVGPFNLNLSVPQPFSWTNESSISTINRGQGVGVTWSGADPNSFIEITGFSLSGTDLSNLLGGGFICTAKASDGKFTVPPAVTLSLPSSASIQLEGISLQTGSLSLSSYSTPVKFAASGLDFGYGLSSVYISEPVTYQ